MDGEELGLIEDVSGAEEEPSGGEGEEVTEGPEPEGEESAEGGEEIAEGEEEARPASRALPTELRKALREFTAGNPDFAKKFPKLERQLTAALFKASQADKMGGLQQLRSAAAALESHGGPERIAAMAEELEGWHGVDAGLEQGDPVLLDTWASAHPEGFKRLVGPSVLKLEALDLAAHDRAISDPMYRTLDRCGVIQSMNSLETAIAGERFEDIHKHFGEIKNFLQELRNFATKAKAPDPLKADREKLEQERSEVQTERQKTFYGGVRTEVSTQTTSYVNRILRQELAGRTLRVETANRLRKQINEDLAAAVNDAPGYKEKYKSVMGANDHGRAVQFIVTAAKAKIPLVVKRVLRDFNLGPVKSGGTVRRPSGGGVRASGTANVVTGRPKTSEVDFNRTDKAQYLGMLGGHGQAYLKSGKLAKW